MDFFICFFDQTGPLGGRYEPQLIEFARSIRGEIVNPVTAEHEFLLHKTLLQACGFSGIV